MTDQRATMTARAAAPPSLMWTTLAPGLFVLLWSTGFIFAKMGLPYVEPFTFVAMRYAVVVALMLPLALVVRATWPTRAVDVAHLLVAGLLLHAVYIAGVFASIYHGLPAGISALIVAGERDNFMPRGLSEEMQQLIPGAELLVVEGGSHTAPIERPQLVNDAVLRFLRKH